MGFLIQLVATYAPWIYAACGLVALYQIYRIWLVRAERRQAVFSLEREKALRDLYRIFYVAMLLLIAMGATYFVGNTLSEAVEPLVVEAQEPDPGIPLVPTPTNTPLPATPTPAATATAPPTVEPTPEEEEVVAATPEPAARPAAAAPVCPDNRSLLIRPGNGEVVSGGFSIIGTATHEQFQYYKIEYAPGGGAEGTFGYLTGGNSPVINGVLGNVNSSELGNGQWTLRLIVVDQTGNFPPPCRVTIAVEN